MNKKQQKALTFYKPKEPTIELELDNQATVDLQAISKSLAQKARDADSVDEVIKVLNVTPLLTNQLDKRQRQDINYESEREKIKSIRFERKLKGVKEGFRITASIASVTIGLYLLSAAPLLSPLLITLGIAGAFNYQLKDVTELASKIYPLNKNFESDNNSETLEK